MSMTLTSFFMTVYSNNMIGDEISFRLWDASEGKFQSQVTINSEDYITFYDGSLIGQISDLTDFNANNTIIQEIKKLLEGWNWCSFNLIEDKFSKSKSNAIPIVTGELNSSNVEVFKGLNSFTFNNQIGWVGSMQSVSLGDMYKIKISESDTISYKEIPLILMILFIILTLIKDGIGLVI